MRSSPGVAAKLIVLAELSIAAGRWSRRTRCAAVWVAVAFHGTRLPALLLPSARRVRRGAVLVA